MPDGVDDLDGEALEIATRYLLDRWTLKQLAGHVPPVSRDATPEAGEVA